MTEQDLEKIGSTPTSRRGFLKLAAVLGLSSVATGVGIGLTLGGNAKKAPEASASEATPTPGVTPEPTEIPTATATSTSTATATAVEPTKVPTATEGPLFEMPNTLNAKNFNQYTAEVPSGEFQKLIKAQPDNFAFPFKSQNQDFEIKYNSHPVSNIATKSEYKTLEVQGTDISLFPPLDGKIIFYCNDRNQPDKITDLSIYVPISNNKGYVISASGMSNFKLNADITPVTEGLTTSKAAAGKEIRGQAKAGQLAAKVSGHVSLYISYVEIMDKPVEIKLPNGDIRTFSTYTTYITPEIFNKNSGTANDWLRTSDGKIAISQN